MGRFFFLFCLCVSVLHSCGPERLSREIHRAEGALDPGIRARIMNPPDQVTHWNPRPTGGQTVRAGVVSHHLLAAGYMDRFFRELSENLVSPRPSAFIILSPRHFQQGRALVAVTDRTWITGMPGTAGEVGPDRGRLTRLVQGGAAVLEPESFTGEHGIGALVPFIAKYFPATPVVPLVLEVEHRRTGQLLKLSGALTALMKEDENLFLLVSSDFSHHGDLPTTRRRDERSRPALELLNSSTQWRVGGDNPPGYFVLGQVLESLGLGRGHIAAHATSYDLSGVDFDITSYFFVYY